MPKPFYMNLQANISPDAAAKLIAAVEDSLRKGMTELHLLIASPGGGVDPGMAIFNFLKGIPARIITYNYGSVDSVASVIYCAGSRRMAAPHCKFLIHNVTWGWGPAPQGLSVSEGQLQEALNQVVVLRKNIASVIGEATGKTLDAVASDMTRSLTLNATEAKEYGLVHEIATSLLPPGVDVIAVR